MELEICTFRRECQRSCTLQQENAKFGGPRILVDEPGTERSERKRPSPRSLISPGPEIWRSMVSPVSRLLMLASSGPAIGFDRPLEIPVAIKKHDLRQQ